MTDTDNPQDLSERQLLQTWAQHQTFALDMFKQAKRTVDIFSADLDPQVLNDRSIEKALSDLARRSRYSQIRLLVYTIRPMLQCQHRLITLYQSLSSYVHIRVVPAQLQQAPYAFYLADERSLVYRPFYTQTEGEGRLDAPLEVKERRQFFDELWQQSEIASELRVLGI
ncbi:hypothetical protein [Pleionea sp. CnH1-48]|uniref:DUF7931 domain-containing protein n=1 Tax=Pleionea sp. CnH1-48 TaxID=2954494 RepID=UPI002097F596|nr:hypothetical protein [Pleionea sp. CnH1-48]MCO7222788.1 hypothetical protein [Pleionea sp. CnH1-48]